MAGAVNAGGFLALRVYTSHMSGMLASVASFLARDQLPIALSAVGALLAFMGGAASTTLIVHWAQRQKLTSVYALPLLGEAALLLLFGVLGDQLNIKLFSTVSFLVVLLGFMMGMQNALITKISNFRIRTTHVTGMVTDIGIELGRLFCSGIARVGDKDATRANLVNLGLLAVLVGQFFAGSLMGAFGFKHFGLLFTVPLAAMLAAVALFPVYDDIRDFFAGFSPQT